MMHPVLLRFLATTLLSASLVSCASSTMDSIPDQAKLEMYKNTARQNYAGDYARLNQERSAGRISNQQYDAEYKALEDRVVQSAHTLAWESHQMAELERVAQGVPTPNTPMNNPTPNAMLGGAGGSSNYRSSLQQYNSMSGIGGSSSMSSGQLNAGRSGGGGLLATPNYPGSIYDESNP